LARFRTSSVIRICMLTIFLDISPILSYKYCYLLVANISICNALIDTPVLPVLVELLTNNLYINSNTN
jgi:hypothetical protein